MVDGLDHVAQTMEAKWGVERLPLLVDDELRAKFERQRVKTYDALRDAYDAPYLTQDTLTNTRGMVEALKRGWSALDAAATADRQMPISAVTTVLEGRTHDGHVLAVVRTNAEARYVLQEGRGTVVMTLDEVANLLAAAGSIITDTLRLFPGTKIQPPRFRSPEWYPEGDQEIPF